ncbi:2-C-methyl-D-erythritol 4-phosphate cytidylyltransferase [Pelosinus sp. sgz500959]|uniref:2-C-methyl-D-erythritol 4-phosphate cytidylyltransferase n=1 Tax=Pelosinus sp. sgz500959 TaxID=3242472 RepID=UPI00366C2C7A
MVTAIIVAAGRGKRMNSDINKVFILLGDQPILLHSVLTFSACTEVDNIVVVAAPDEVEDVESLLSTLPEIKGWQVVAGGCERQYSIANALKIVPQSTDLILVHDGARPLVSKPCINRVIQVAREQKAAVAAVAVKDTIKVVDEHGSVIDTPARNTLWSIQTPQGFTAELLRQAYDRAEKDGYLGTDDASLVERLGVDVKIVVGSYDNIKVTTPEDLTIAEALIKQEDTRCNNKKREGENMIRFGMGYDVHKLVEGRKLILGGVEIPYIYGLDGHSDADVLLHGIKDALLGAAALGDIGRHFPDTDMRYKGVSSIILLERVREIIAEHGYIVNNIDATIVAERPKLASYIPDMNQKIAEALQVEVGQINVKATTTEGLGFAGKGAGIAAYAVASIVKNK